MVNAYFILFFKVLYFKILFIFIFREKGKEGEREEGKHKCVVASQYPLLGTWPATQACALTGNQTGDPLVPKPVLNPLSRTSQGCMYYFNKYSSRTKIKAN